MIILEESFSEPSEAYILKYPKWQQNKVHVWRKQTGIEIIYGEVSRRKLDDLWKSWNKMPSNLKQLSDQKSLEFYGMTNEIHYKQLIEKSIYDGFDFILHQHHPHSGSLHHDLRFMDLKNKKLLHSFAAPSDFIELLNSRGKCTVFKTRDHDPRWLTLKSYRLKNIDVGTVDYKLYRTNYFLLNFHGSIINGLYQLFKLKNRQRDDVWLFIKKK